MQELSTEHVCKDVEHEKGKKEEDTDIEGAAKAPSC